MKSIRYGLMVMLVVLMPPMAASISDAQQLSFAPLQLRDARRPNLWFRHDNATSNTTRNYTEDNNGREQFRGVRIGFFNPLYDLTLTPPAPSEIVQIGGGVDTGVRFSKRLWQGIVVEDHVTIRKNTDFTIAMLIEPRWENHWQGLACKKAVDSNDYSIMTALMPVPSEQTYRLGFYTNASGWGIASAPSRFRDYDEYKIRPNQMTHVAVSVGNCYQGWNNEQYCNVKFYVNGIRKLWVSMRPGSVNYGNLHLGSWYTTLYANHPSFRQLQELRQRGELVPPIGEREPLTSIVFRQLPDDQRFSNIGLPAHPEYNFSGTIGETMFWDHVVPDNQIRNLADDLRSGTVPAFRQ